MNKFKTIIILSFILLMASCFCGDQEQDISILFSSKKAPKGVSFKAKTFNYCFSTRYIESRERGYEIYVILDGRPAFKVERVNLDMRRLPTENELRRMAVEKNIDVVISKDRKHLTYSSSQLKPKLYHFLPKGPGFPATPGEQKVLIKNKRVDWSKVKSPESSIIKALFKEKIDCDEEYLWNTVSANPEKDELLIVYFDYWEDVDECGDIYWKTLKKLARKNSGVSKYFRARLMELILNTIRNSNFISQNQPFTHFDSDVIQTCLINPDATCREAAIDLIMSHYEKNTDRNRHPIWIMENYGTKKEMKKLAEKYPDDEAFKLYRPKPKNLWERIKRFFSF
ncbi:MAG: hypothetical protein GY714_07785 [Desulfobacterales bacterium]|nr:hypothetical protein [Desulfobacterales bacterium]